MSTSKCSVICGGAAATCVSVQSIDQFPLSLAARSAANAHVSQI